MKLLESQTDELKVSNSYDNIARIVSNDENKKETTRLKRKCEF